jgi:formamidopyrimidine-DNA glycosylase
MPELPEVEVTRAGLADRLLGAKVQSARLGKPLRWPLGISPDSLQGRHVGVLQRRGKYLWMPLSRDATLTPTVQNEPEAGAPDRDEAGGLLLHLGMSGSLKLTALAELTPLSSQPGPHDHFDLLTSRGLLRLTDPRRFGAVVWSPALTQDPAARLLARLGAEPFDSGFTPALLHAALQGRKTTVKAALLAGDIVVGAGNIYASEALHRAAIDPRTRCNSLSRPRCERLLAALRLTLARAIELGGSTLRDFRDAHGMSGAFQTEALVYGREGQACARCGGTVRRIVQGQRASYFCAGCQRR